MSSMFPNPILAEAYRREAERYEKEIQSHRRWSRFNRVFGWTGYVFAVYFGVMSVRYVYAASFESPWNWIFVGTYFGCCALWLFWTAPRSMKNARTYRELEENARQRRGEARLQAALYSEDEPEDVL